MFQSVSDYIHFSVFWEEVDEKIVMKSIGKLTKKSTRKLAKRTKRKILPLLNLGKVKKCRLLKSGKEKHLKL